MSRIEALHLEKVSWLAKPEGKKLLNSMLRSALLHETLLVKTESKGLRPNGYGATDSNPVSVASVL